MCGSKSAKGLGKVEYRLEDVVIIIKYTLKYSHITGSNPLLICRLPHAQFPANHHSTLAAFPSLHTDRLNILI